MSEQKKEIWVPIAPLRLAYCPKCQIPHFGKDNPNVIDISDDEIKCLKCNTKFRWGRNLKQKDEDAVDGWLWLPFE